MIPLHRDLVLDHEYHVVEISSWPHNLEEWLTDKFGPPGTRWFVNRYNKIYFRDERDWMWFELST
jgi:hypothetical protein